jgi:hypothetical protein
VCVCKIPCIFNDNLEMKYPVSKIGVITNKLLLKIGSNLTS